MSSRVSDELLRKIKESVNILEVVGEHVVLRKSGSNYSGLCPFHNERSPSFSVSEQKQLYHCYGCRKGGDLIGFVMDMHGLSFMEAIEELAERAKLQLPSEIQADLKKGNHSEKSEKQALAFRLNRFVAGFYHQNLSKNPPLKDYFLSRGVSEELKKIYYVGGATSDWDSLTRFLIEKKAPLPLAQEMGLIKQSTKANSVGYFDFFRNRALFPILDLRGRVVGFGGRLIPTDEDEVQTSKYLNSSESILFQKNKILFGLHQAQKYIREKSQVIIVEGFFDALALYASGFKNVVATCGTALTAEHITLLKRFSDQIICLFDSDNAGVQATQKAMELGLEQGQVIFGLSLPKLSTPIKDPDEFLLGEDKKAPVPERVELLKNEIQNVKALIDQSIDEQVESARKNPEAQSKAVKQIAAWLSKFKDPVGREIRLQKAVKELGLGRAVFEKAGLEPSPARQDQRSQNNAAQSFRQSMPSQRKAIVPVKGQPLKLSGRERLLIRALVKGERSLFDLYLKELPPNMTISDLFDYSPVRDFTAPAFETSVSAEAFWKDPQTFLRSVNDPHVLSTITEALVGSNEPMDPEQIKGAIGSALRRSWARFSHHVKQRLGEAERSKDNSEHARLMQEYLDVQRKIKEFSSFYDQSEG